MAVQNRTAVLQFSLLCLRSQIPLSLIDFVACFNVAPHVNYINLLEEFRRNEFWAFYHIYVVNTFNYKTQNVQLCKITHSYHYTQCTYSVIVSTVRLRVEQNTCLMSSCGLFFRKPFPIGDRVTFCGKKCVCQQCSHSLVSNAPVKIHGPSRKSLDQRVTCSFSVNHQTSRSGNYWNVPRALLERLDISTSKSSVADI